MIESHLLDLDNYLHNIKLDKDYYLGDWKACILFGKNLVNLDLIKSPYKDIWLDFIDELESIGAIGISLNKFSPNCNVLEHTDSDLINTNNIIRMFIPLNDVEFQFKGTFILNNNIVNQSIITKDNIVFLPTQIHSFINGNEDGYFAIVDIAKDSTHLSKDFWLNYLTFSIDNYILN